MAHTPHTLPHRPAAGLPAIPDRLFAGGFVALVILTAIALVLIFGPLLVALVEAEPVLLPDPIWLPDLVPVNWV